MLARCYNPEDTSFDNYGGRGIAVCERWQQSFDDFVADVGLRPSPEHSIERLDNDGNYEPGNVIWATRDVQCRNRRSNVMLTMNGRTQCLKDWTEELGLDYKAVHARIAAGWNSEEALTTPLRRMTRRAQRIVLEEAV